MRVQILLSVCLLTASCSYSQDTLTAQSERLIIEGRDTFVAVPYARAKVLFASIAALSKRVENDSISIATKTERLNSCLKSKSELHEALDLRESITMNQLSQIENLKQMQKNTRKKWIRNALYAGCGGLTAGLITGIIIVK